ncbi:MAG: hypothetical protein M1821_003135 [Bathelium mastoideum]|nr:MAG: hypothetical protein M1821_003135 [Bathelium mastoideum]KAI9688186.1 MAG: hypothetical protein M1822_001692 [Bathelium mastoideum]
MDFVKRTDASSLLARSEGTLDLTAQKSFTVTPGGAYLANITVGNPPQAMQVFLDSGSSNLALNTPSGCHGRSPDNVCVGGAFDYTKSQSFKMMTTPVFNVSYVDGSGEIGSYGTDDISFAGITLKNATFGVGSKSTMGTGIMGIGPDADIYSRSHINQTIPSTLDALVDAGIIDSKLFSVWLNDISSDSGSILFGGVDESKFDATTGLVTLDMIRDPLTQVYDFYLVSMTNLSTNINGKTTAVPLPSSNNSFTPDLIGSPYIPAVADTGCSPILLPPSLFSAINANIGATRSPDLPEQAYGLPCSQAQNETLKDSVISWTLGDPKNGSISITYNVTIADLVIPVYKPGTNEQVGDTCAFGLQPTLELDFVGMGDPFLRKMYVVFDQDNKQLSFGYPIFNATGEKAVQANATSNLPDVTKSEPKGDEQGTVTGTLSVATQTTNAAAGVVVPGTSISWVLTAYSTITLIAGALTL